jgi:hypothetical protein
MSKAISILTTVFAFSFVGAASANACTVWPVNPTEQKNDLIANALTKMDVSIENVNKVLVNDYSGDYMWTPMCPEGLKSEATFSIEFRNVKNRLSKGCTATVKVMKNWIYDEGSPTYAYDFLQAATCQE